jgi:hypothetical protein
MTVSPLVLQAPDLATSESHRRRVVNRSAQTGYFTTFRRLRLASTLNTSTAAANNMAK